MLLVLSILLCAATAVAQTPQTSTPAGGQSRPLEDSVYVYEIFKTPADCAVIQERLKALPLRPGLILSIDQGPEFVLDRPEGDQQLLCAAEFLRKSGRTVKAMLLQDPIFLDRGEEAVRRAALVGGFHAKHPGLLAGAQADVEPYTIPDWGCLNAGERQTIMRGLHELLTRVRRNLNGLPLGIVAPWWYPVVKDLPEAWPSSLYQVADEVYLMAYGDEGGPLIGGTADRVLGRVNAPEFFTGKGRLYIALAAYEFKSPEDFERELQIIRARLASRPNFAGTTLFHAASAFNVPLGRFVSGTVVDESGQGIAGAELRANGTTGKTNRCGQFMLRVEKPKVELTVKKEGLGEKSLPAEVAAPGGIREVGKIQLQPKPAAEKQ